MKNIAWTRAEEAARRHGSTIDPECTCEVDVVRPEQGARPRVVLRVPTAGCVVHPRRWRP